MARSILPIAFLLTGLTLPLAADTLSVTTTLRGPQQGDSVQVQLRAKRAGGSGAPIERTISVPGTAVLDVPAGNWDVSLDSPLFWAAPVVASTGRPAALELWPAGTLHGRLAADGKGAAVQELRVAFAPAPGREAEQPEGGSVCAVSGDRWRCLVPAGTHDLRFLSAGFGAELRWKQEVPAGRDTDLRTLVFRRGASLIGSVSPARGLKAEMKHVTIVARPRPVLAQAGRAYTVTPNPRGVFQIAGLSAGEYVIHAETKGLRSDDRVVTVLEARNAELRAPLVLDAPKKIVVAIASPASSAADPWHLRLDRFAEGGRLEEVLAAAADAEGRWTGAVFAPGEYVLQVGRGDGTIWKTTPFAVGAADVFLDMAIPVARVTGTVRVGDRLLADARLVFGSIRGVGALTLATDGDGAFSGELPAQEDPDAKWTIEIRADHPQVARTGDYEAARGEDGELRFDIVLPRTMVSGRVVNEDGTPAVNAWVSLQAEGVFEQTLAGEGGAFELTGFAPGVYRIQADAFQRTSDVVEVSATDAEAAPVELVLRSDVIVRGRIRSRAATGVEARLFSLPRETRPMFAPNAATDAQGLFELKLPPRTRTFDLIVQAPGFAVAMGRVEIQDEKMLTITVDQSGGSLAIEVPSDGDAMLRHEGGEYPLRLLSRVLGGSIETNGDWAVARFVNVEPGAYSVCAKGQCRSGVVPPHGDVAISFR